MATGISPQWEAFANWLAMDEVQRERLNLPRNQTEYAIAHKISDRQLRRWKNDPLFKGLLEKKLASKGKSNTSGLSAVSANGVEAVFEPDEDVTGGSSLADSPEDDYAAIKSTLVKGALTGEPKYLDLYFKTYGKEFVAEEAAARSSNYSGLDMDDLILEAAVFLGVDRIADYLRSEGWEVSPPKRAGDSTGPGDPWLSGSPGVSDGL